MTIVVYRDGIMAADTRSWLDATASGDVEKISTHRHGRNVVLGAAAGVHHLAYKFHALVRSGVLPVDQEGYEGLDFTDEGAAMLAVAPKEVHIFEGDKSFIVDDGGYYAIGAGRELALGALAHGASAIEAVDVAIRMHAFCGGDIIWRDHKGNAGRIKRKLKPLG